MAQHTYYTEGQFGYDPSKPRKCPKCGGKSYSSNQISGTAKCPHCGHTF
ncbi:hypothetical protein ACWOC1_10590 [Enterococcus quebecensis]|nr:hypothetical protein [Enterococcus quebecensis]